MARPEPLLPRPGIRPARTAFEIVCDGGTLTTDGGTLHPTRLEVPESVFTRENKTPFASPKAASCNVETDGKKRATRRRYERLCRGYSSRRASGG